MDYDCDKLTLSFMEKIKVTAQQDMLPDDLPDFKVLVCIDVTPREIACLTEYLNAMAAELSDLYDTTDNQY